ncbi:la protein homolog [Chrysoperla carnea]|uniref:la protein homolog n=1 Tax=Chrysoperla carnea TaxID=189513 RepID=UPI001D0927C9|nr:la protein homolog [Chrysoperla carnea]
MANVDVENAPKNGEEKNETPKDDSNEIGVKRPLSDNKSDETGETDETPAKKAKVTNEPPNELEKKIIRQIEYYFGDVNLSRDKFMQGKIAEDNGWIPLSVMLTFKRLASISTDTEVILNALSKSETQLVQVSEDRLKIRRVPEIPIPEFNEERRKELSSRTAYAKGFPLNADIDDILKWFEDKPNVEGVNKRMYLDRSTKKFMFKGSVFVIFKTIEDCKKFVEGGPYHYDTDKAELIVKWQETYIEEKKKERQDSKNSLSKLKESKTKNDDTKLDSEMNECSIVHISGLVPETLRDDIKSKFIETYDVDVKYVEFESGETEAYIRLQGSDSGAKLLEKTKDEKIDINGGDIKLRVLEGEELEKHIEKVKASMINRRNKFNCKKKNKRGGKPKGRK